MKYLKIHPFNFLRRLFLERCNSRLLHIKILLLDSAIFVIEITVEILITIDLKIEVSLLQSSLETSHKIFFAVSLSRVLNRFQKVVCFNVWPVIRTTDVPDATTSSLNREADDYLTVSLRDGGVAVGMTLAKGRLDLHIKPVRVRFDDNQWHKIIVHRKVQEQSAVKDGKCKVMTSFKGVAFNVHSLHVRQCVNIMLRSKKLEDNAKIF
ncbi:hypothetical protein WN51_10910 [Melipona quadrifasciata]|uniref:Laminin G domain-containing protein n=1 Tax=Melipona quadrifasciata TaxID=166423 RepID=A0A0N0BI68_9HYME|nr:hypothetical protein WN51_10910 [Melipona quadrifasciata]